MYRRVFKPKGGRVYRLRYRVGDEAKINDVPLRTASKEIAHRLIQCLGAVCEVRLANQFLPAHQDKRGRY